MRADRKQTDGQTDRYVDHNTSYVAEVMKASRGRKHTHLRIFKMITIITMTRITNITPTTRPITRLSSLPDFGEVGKAVLKVGPVAAVIVVEGNTAVVDSISFDATLLAVVVFASEV